MVPGIYEPIHHTMVSEIRCQHYGRLQDASLGQFAQSTITLLGSAGPFWYRQHHWEIYQHGHTNTGGKNLYIRMHLCGSRSQQMLTGSHTTET